MLPGKYLVTLNLISMKTLKKILLIFISLLSLNNCLAQDYSSIKPSLLSVVNNTDKTFPFFGTKDQLLTAFGQPLKIVVVSDEDSDMLDYSIKVYHYNGIILTLENRPNKIVCIDFTISSTNYGVKYGTHIIKINDTIDNLKNVFPDSFNFMNTIDKKNFLRIGFADRYDTVEVPYYSYLTIDFDKTTRKITKIEIFVDP